MRRAEVPIRIAFADSQNGTVAHVNRNKDAFARVCGNGTFADNQFADVNVIVNRVEGVDGRLARLAEQNLRNEFEVSSRKFLTKFHVVQVLMKIFAVNVT